MGEIILAPRTQAIQKGRVDGEAVTGLFPPADAVKALQPRVVFLCIDAKDYLSDKGYCFQEIDVGKDRRAYEEMKQLSAQTYVPTFVAGDKVLANFDTDQLEKFLNEHKINP